MLNIIVIATNNLKFDHGYLNGPPLSLNSTDLMDDEIMRRKNERKIIKMIFKLKI